MMTAFTDLYKSCKLTPSWTAGPDDPEEIPPVGFRSSRVLSSWAGCKTLRGGGCVNCCGSVSTAPGMVGHGM